MKVSDWKGKKSIGEVINSKQPRIILFAAHWCGFCARFIQLIKNTTSSYEDEIVLIDADDPDESLWDDFGINFVPTLIVFREGMEISRRRGRSGSGLAKADLEAAIESAKAAR